MQTQQQAVTLALGCMLRMLDAAEIAASALFKG